MEMAWHEILAWVIIAVAVIATIVWCVKLIVCPQSKCAECGKNCVLKRDIKTNK